MGAGASSMRELDLGVTTLVLGQALAAITFPDMFRLHDFHSPRAPRLCSVLSVAWFGGLLEEQELEADDDYTDPPPEQYQHLFRVQLGDQVIYIEDVLQPNALGWTPLHACCHSSNTMGAEFKIIEEMQRRGGDFNTKTLRGPGIFNSGWTALHMATAYGLEPVVAMILNAGADPNCCSSYGFTPLFEACHRGFAGIARLLVEAKADLNALPTEEEADSCPLLSAPPQAPLGEAARFGFTPIVELLLEAGANKNFQNVAGWTPLHEAAFYNHAYSVQLLLVHGADATITCNRGLVPWQLSRSNVVKEMIAEMGGPSAVVHEETEQQHEAATARLEGEEEGLRTHVASAVSSSPERRVQIDDTNAERSPSTPKKKPHSPTRQHPQSQPQPTTPTFSLLGDLPSLHARRVGSEAAVEVQNILDVAEPKALSPSLKLQSTPNRTPLTPKDAPQEFMCALSKQLMCDPVRTTYGQVFEKEMILAWIKQHGHICPITAMPLAESDLIPDGTLRDRILAWKMGKDENAEPTPSETPGNQHQHNDDDVYEF